MSEIALLLAELATQRGHVIDTLTGLSERQQWSPVPPLTWAPIAAVHHLALDVERWWLQAVVAGNDSARAYFAEHPGGAWTVPAGSDPIALYRAECELSDDVIRAADLEGTAAAWPSSFGQPQTVREIVLHVITETAAHAGQLDVARERIDGHQHMVID